LVLEISDASWDPPRDPLVVKVAASPVRPSRTPRVYEKGCDIGERMRFGGAR
jgi:hypothetical protein